MPNNTNIHETNGGSVTVGLPLSFHPKFIGKLIKLRGQHRDDSPIFERLCTAVKQCRTYNEYPERRTGLLPLMERTQQELAERGVVIG